MIALHRLSLVRWLVAATVGRIALGLLFPQAARQAGRPDDQLYHLATDIAETKHVHAGNSTIVARAFAPSSSATSPKAAARPARASRTTPPSTCSNSLIRVALALTRFPSIAWQCRARNQA